MIGLLLKDWLSILKQAKMYLLLIVFFSIMPGNMTTFAILYASMMPIAALGYDDQSKWNSLAVMMPYSIRDLVVSKYLFGFVAIIVSSVICFIVRYALELLNLGTSVSIGEVALRMAVGVALICITLPFMIRFGVEKGRLVIYGLVGLTVAAGFVIEKTGVDILQGPSVTVLLIVFLVLLIPLSIVLSMKAFVKRNLN